MKLHENQLNLIRHLIRFNLMAYEDCLEMLDTDDSKDRTALSYAFRPLTKNKYLSVLLKPPSGCVPSMSMCT